MVAGRRGLSDTLPGHDLPPEPAAGISIRGGIGPSYADLAELRAAAQALATAAERLEDAAQHVAAADLAIGLGEQDSPTTARAARDALAAFQTGPTSLRAGAARALELARALRRAADLYGEAEDHAAAVMRTVLSSLGTSLAGRPVVAAIAGVWATQVTARLGALALGWRLLRGQPLPTPKEVAVALPTEELAAGLGSFLRAAAPGWQGSTPRPVPGAARTLVGGAGLTSVVVPGLRRRPLQVSPRLGETTQGPPPVGAAEVLRDVGALYPLAGGTAGTVGVERIEHPEGGRSWVVAIPGMQTGAMGWGTNPMDNATNLRLMAGIADDGTALVARAMDQAGVRPGEPVLLAGHSQGGMVAMALAGSAAFRERYRVAAVLTAGSPVARMAGAPGVPVLHLEHAQDLVPAIDGAPPPALTHRTTATRDLTASTDPADRMAARDPGEAHGIEAYVRTARAVSASGAASVQAWEVEAGQIWGGAGAQAVRMQFTGTRGLPAGGAGPASAAGSPPSPR